jgi:hypothetical protein
MSSEENILSSIASAIAVAMMVENVRKGHVIRIPSIGVIITSSNLKDPAGAIPASREEVIEALEECLNAQKQKLERTIDLLEQQKIQKVIAELQEDISDPSEYL